MQAIRRWPHPQYIDRAVSYLGDAYITRCHNYLTDSYIPWCQHYIQYNQNSTSHQTYTLFCCTVFLWGCISISYVNSLHFLWDVSYEDFIARSRYLRQGKVIISHSKLWDVITNPCLRYLLLATKSSYVWLSNSDVQAIRPGLTHGI